MAIDVLSELPTVDRLGHPIYPDYRNMLRLEKLLHEDEKEMPPGLSTLCALQLLYGSDIPNDIDAAISELMWFYMGGVEEDTPANGLTKEPIFDFEEDAPFIHAGFLSSYNIRLADTSVRMHWWEFLALFIALPANTRIVERMCDRAVDTSKLKGEAKREAEKRKQALRIKKKRKKVTAGNKKPIAVLEQETKDRVAQRFKEAEAARKAAQKEG